jgi:hypothetical protein
LNWIYDMPYWSGALLFSAVFVGFTWLGIVLIRPWVRRHVADQPGWNTLIGAIFAGYVVFYGITLALLAISTFQNFSAVNQTVGREASALGTLYRDVSSYPDPIRGELQAMLRDYSRYVIEEDWPAQQQGDIPEEGTARTSAFQDRLLSFQPQTRAEEILHAATIGRFDDFVDYRRQRLHSVSMGLPAALWLVVGIGVVLNTVLICLFDVDRLIVHLIIGGILPLFVALLVFLMVEMDAPFQGEVSISTDAFQLVQRSLMEEDR